MGISVKDKLDGNRLDLSMLRLTDVPVKEIASVPRATRLDLSSNQLEALPANFATSLQHITYLELGANKLKKLPENFGSLTNLKHLDLYNNQLTEFPVSVWKLRNLRWLDVKGNPLSKELNLLGDCLNTKECEAAAKNLVAHYKTVQSEMERQKQKKLKEAKEKEAAAQRQEEEERAKKRADKKAAKEKRKAEAKLRDANKDTLQNGNSTSDASANGVKEQRLDVPVKKKKKQNYGCSCLGIINFLLFLCLLMSASGCAFLYMNGDVSVKALEAAFPRLVENTNLIVNTTVNFFEKDNLKETASTIQNRLIAWSESCVIFLEQYLSDLSPVTSAMKKWWIIVWTYTVNIYMWIRANIDFEAIWTSFLIFCGFMYDQWLVLCGFMYGQWLVLCEELKKNEALVSVSKSFWIYLEHMSSSVCVGANLLYEYLCVLWAYILEVAPSWWQSIENQSLSMYNFVKTSLENLVK